MWEEVLKLAVGNGLWAALSCVLLFYLLRDSRKREKKYTDIIDAMAERLRAVVQIKAETEKILAAVLKEEPPKKPQKRAPKSTAKQPAAAKAAS
jgi:hypothetical protein